MQFTKRQRELSQQRGKLHSSSCRLRVQPLLIFSELFQFQHTCCQNSSSRYLVIPSLAQLSVGLARVLLPLQLTAYNESLALVFSCPRLMYQECQPYNQSTQGKYASKKSGLPLFKFNTPITNINTNQEGFIYLHATQF